MIARLGGRPYSLAHNSVLNAWEYRICHKSIKLLLCLNFFVARSVALCSNCDPCSSNTKLRAGLSFSFFVCSVDPSASSRLTSGCGMSKRKTVCFFGMANRQVSKKVQSDSYNGQSSLLLSSFFFVMIWKVNFVSRTTIPANPTIPTHLPLTTVTSAPW